jgi:hypothetical protein
MMSLSVRALLQLTATLTSASDLTTAEAPVSIGKQQNFTNGAGADQADLIWTDRRTVAASSTDSLDLAGSLTDVFGATLTFARIKLIYVSAASGNTNNVNVTRPASNGVPLFLAAGDGIAVKPDGAFVWIAPDASGVAVTASTGDLIDIVNSGAGSSVTYDIVVVGAAS